MPQAKPVFEIRTVKNGCFLALLAGSVAGNEIRYTVGINADAWLVLFKNSTNAKILQNKHENKF